MLRSFFVFLVSLVGFCQLAGQTAPSFFFVEFTDKKNTPYSIHRPQEFLSSASIARRARQHIAITEEDLPVNPWYLDSLRFAGAAVVFSSKWFNAATVRIDSLTDEVLFRISGLPFVKNTSRVKKNMGTNQAEFDLLPAPDQDDFGTSFTHFQMHNGQALHRMGGRGEGKLIAVLDAGYLNAHYLQAFQHLWLNGKIRAAYDVYTGTGDVFRKEGHGMLVFSIMGGYLPGKLLGTAPQADYLLVRTEQGASEFLIEEDAWVRGAEYADSFGCDIINSSLGYTTFDSAWMNHTYADMDGRTARVSIGAGKAASKGILVVNSAGNQGARDWRYISAPADAVDILAVGAVHADGRPASFSSRGPSADRRTKPEVAAMGVQVPSADPNNDGDVVRINGTSAAAPVVAGFAASLWSLMPEASAMQVRSAIVHSANQHGSPDTLRGYGIPDFLMAYHLLQNTAPESLVVMDAYPNPVARGENLVLPVYAHHSGNIYLEVYDMTGRRVHFSATPAQNQQIANIALPWQYASGLYVARIALGTRKAAVNIVGR